jgi:hypothetical protein
MFRSLSENGGGDVKTEVLNLNLGVTADLGAVQSDDHSTTKLVENKVEGGSTKSIGGFMGKNDGDAFSVTNGHSESDTEETRVGDGLSDAKMNTSWNERFFQNSLSDTVGNSKNHGEGYTNRYIANENYDMFYSEIKGLAVSSDISNAKAEGTALTTSVSQVLDIPAGTYGVAALLLLTESTQVQFICIEGEYFLMKMAKKF